MRRIYFFVFWCMCMGSFVEAIPIKGLFEVLSNLQEEKKPPFKMTIVENLSQDPKFSFLVEILQDAELSNLLNQSGPFTLFAPVNEAFDQLPTEKLMELFKPENKALLATLLKYHILPGKKTPGMLKSGKFKALNGKELEFSFRNNEFFVNGVKLELPETIAMNGIIYTIESVLSL